jgi:hypothetical protein
MQTRLKKSVIGLGVALIAGASLIGPASAAGKQTRNERSYQARTSERHDWNKSHRDRRNWSRYPNDAYAQSPNWARRNMDPYGNRCVTDLGYGRYEYCNW